MSDRPADLDRLTTPAIDLEIGMVRDDRRLRELVRLLFDLDSCGPIEEPDSLDGEVKETADVRS